MGTDHALAARMQRQVMVVVQHVAIGPVFVQVAPRAQPIIEYLGADHMPARPPHMVPGICRLHVVVPDQQIVHVLDFKGEVVEAGALPANAK